MQVKAKTRYLPISSQKLALVCDKVRGMGVEEALVVLDYMPQKGADLVRKTVASATANAENNFELTTSSSVGSHAKHRTAYKPRSVSLQSLSSLLSPSNSTITLTRFPLFLHHFSYAPLNPSGSFPPCAFSSD